MINISLFTLYNNNHFYPSDLSTEAFSLLPFVLPSFSLPQFVLLSFAFVLFQLPTSVLPRFFSPVLLLSSPAQQMPTSHHFPLFHLPQYAAIMHDGPQWWTTYCVQWEFHWPHPFPRILSSIHEPTPHQWKFVWLDLSQESVSADPYK